MKKTTFFLYNSYIVMVLFLKIKKLLNCCKKGKEIKMAEKEALVVASKIKNYIKDQADLKCSAKVIDALSDKIRTILDDAIEAAKKDKRKTVQERDV